MKRKRIPLIVIQIALVVLMPLNWVFAQGSLSTTKNVTWTLRTLTGSDTLRLEGYRSSATFNLTLLQGWEPATDGNLVLDYRISDLVLAGASLTVRLNDQSLYSVAFESPGGLLTFDLPAELFQPGTNTVEVVAFLPLEEDQDCIVPNHPARWLEFGPASGINLTLESVEIPLTLADFAAQFETMGDDQSARVVFVIPDEPDDDELSALSGVAFGLSRSTVARPDWSIVTASDFRTEDVDGPVVLIGATGWNPFLDPLAPVHDPESGWLSLARPDWSRGETVLAVGGDNGKAVLQAADALVDPLATFQMSGHEAVVKALPHREADRPAERFTLADLGYSERVARGVGEHSLIYAFDLPFAWSPGDGALELHFIHSAMLDAHVADLVVLLNGRTLSDIRLDAPEESSNVVGLSIPQALIRPGRNFLRLTFHFGTPIEQCEVGSAQQGPWAVVRPDSTLSFPHGDYGGRIDLGDLPYLFASEVDLGNLAFVLPTQNTASDFTAVLDLVRSLGISDSRAAPRWVHAEAVDGQVKRSHLIVLGDPSQQPLLAELNPHLYWPFELDTGAVLPTYGIRLPSEAPDLGVIQLLRSPWAEKRVILVVTGTSPDGYNRARRLLTDPPSLQELSGQLAVVSVPEGGDEPLIYSQVIADVGSVPGVSAVDRFFERSFGLHSPWPAIILILATLLVLAVAGFVGRRWYRWRQESPSGDH